MGVAVVVVVAVAFYAVYLRPPDPATGTATIEVTGTPGTRFEGYLWTPTSGQQRHIEGTVPRTFELAYVQDDLVMVSLGKVGERPEGTRSTLKVAILADGRTVAERQMRAGDPGVGVTWFAPHQKLKP